MQHRLYRPFLPSVLCVLLAAGCQGSLSSDKKGANTGPGGGGSSGGESILGVQPGLTCAPNVDPGRTVLRRPTRDEYDNTVRDLLGDATRPGRGFPDDDQSAADQLILTSLLLEKYETAAASVVDAAWQRELTSSAKRALVRLS